MKDEKINPICTQVSKIKFDNNINVAPILWYTNILLDTGKPDLIAILILSDIWYWYKLSVITDENTRKVIGYKQKFKADKLQRSYSYYETTYGLSRSQAKRAFDRLISNELITREFRNITVGDRTLSSVMYAEPIPENVVKVSFLKEIDGGYSKVKGGSQICEGGLSNLSSTPSKFVKHTETTSETSTVDFSKEKYTRSKERGNNPAKHLGQGNNETKQSIPLDSPKVKKRFLIKKKVEPAAEETAAEIKREKFKNIKESLNMKSPKKKRKPCYPAQHKMPYLALWNNAEVRKHLRNDTKVYWDTSRIIGKLINGTFFTEKHEGCEHLIGKKITLKDFERAIGNFELVIHSPDHEPASRSVKAAWGNYSFPEYIYNERGNGTKSLFAKYFTNPPRKLEKVAEEKLTPGQKEALSTLVKEYESAFGVSLNNNGDMKYAIRCVQHTVPDFFKSIKPRIKPKSYLEKQRSPVSKTRTWIEMLADLYKGMENPHPGILNSDNTRKKAYMYFGKTYYLKGFSEMLENARITNDKLLAHMGYT